MKNSINWRKADHADLALLEQFRAGLYRDDPSSSGFDPIRSCIVLRDFLGRPDFGGIWIVEADGKPVGYAVLCLGWSLEWGGQDAFLDELYIEKEQRGRGIGALTVNFLARKALDLGANALHAEARENNPRAAKLYKRLGFKPHDSIFLTLRLRDEG